MLRANPKKNGKKKEKVVMTAAQVDRMKREITKEATDKATLLVLMATSDELGLTVEQIERIAILIDRYAGYVDDKLVDLRFMQKTLEKQTGLRYKGW